MSELPGIINEYFPLGVRIMVVLLEDDAAQPPGYDYCNYYADKYGIDQEKLPVLIDPAKKSQIFYESGVVSLSVITNRQGVITYKDEVNNAGAFKWQLNWELKLMCEELFEETDMVFEDYLVTMCEGYDVFL